VRGDGGRPRSGSHLRITLTNPAWKEVVVLEEGEFPAGAFELDVPVIGFSGDESVNGTWTLTVGDHAGGPTGRLDSWSVRIGSRFD
jgi:subtilisin-like proprotein convertase family protein